MLYSILLAAGLLLTIGVRAAPPLAPSSIPLPTPFASAKIFAKNFPSIGVRVGDSEDMIKVLLDTGSSQFWVNPAKNPRRSSTTHFSTRDFSLHYGSGSLAGHIISDDLHIGFANQLNVSNREFGLGDINMTEMTSKLGGIIGLSLYDPTQMQWPGGWDMLSPALTPRVFGLRMQQPLLHGRSDPEEEAGQIDWGASDPKYVQQGITYTQVVAGKEQSGWYINTQAT